MKIKPFIAIILTAGLLSCTSIYQVTIGEDWTAEIEVNGLIPDFQKLYSSRLISNIDTSLSHILVTKFKIADIDSLGGYLPGAIGPCLQFNKVDNDVLKIQTVNCDSLEFGINEPGHFNLVIKFNRSIEKVESNEGRDKKVRSQSVVINRDIRKIQNKKEKVDVQIKLKPY